MPDNWFYVSQKKKVGPCTFEQLQELAAFGTLQPTDMVLAPPGQKWAAARDIPGLLNPSAAPTQPALQERALTALKKVPRWVWYAAGPAVVVLFCCGGVGIFGIVAMIRPGPQAAQSTGTSVAAAATSKDSKDSKEPPDTKKTPAPASEGIDAKAFYAEFRRNFSAAQSKYHDKIVTLRGAMVSVEGSELRAGVITVTLDKGYSSAEFSGAQKDRATKLKRGDTIAFRGRLLVVSDLFTGVALSFRECEFVE